MHEILLILLIYFIIYCQIYLLYMYYLAISAYIDDIVILIL